jgi:primary-amine oxidase
VRSWANRNENVVDEDLVLFVQFGINHVPRIEDFPVMPCEILKVAFKPVNFFDKNPALDVPPSTQAFNQSVGLNKKEGGEQVAQQHQQSVGTATIDSKGEVCCSSKL